MNQTMDQTTSSSFVDHLWSLSTTEQANIFVSKNNENDGDEISHFSRPLLTFAAVMTIIIMVVGICGNLLTIVALIKCPKVRNVAAAFIISLCVADCIFCAIVLPFSAFRFIQGTWTHGELLCRLIPFIQYGNIGVSLLCIAMITINRYIMIAHHNSYAKIYKRHWIGAMIAFCWLFSYGMQLPTFFKVWGAFGYDKKLGTCSILKDEYGRSSKTALFVIAFVIPCIIIVGCYARIFWVVHESEVRLRKHASKQNSIPNNLRQVNSNVPTGNRNSGDGIPGNRISSPISSSSFSSGGRGSINGTTNENNHYSVGGNASSQKSIRIKDQRDVKARRNEWRITKMVLAIFLSFIMCYLPITVIKVTDKDVKMPGFHIFGYIMLYLSSCINPIIYVIMNKQYRQAYKTVLMCKPSRLLPFTNAGSSVGEKWKDIGYSYNHSRTMVSQVSIIDQNNSCNQPPPVAIMELTNNNISNNLNRSQTNNRTTNQTITKTSQTNQTSTTPNLISNNIALHTNNAPKTTINTMENNYPLSHQTINNNNYLQQASAQLESQQQSIQMPDSRPQRGTHITLEEDDVILEEVEPEMTEESIKSMKDIPDNKKSNYSVCIKNIDNIKI